MATVIQLVAILLISSLSQGQRFNVNRGLQRPGLVGGRGPQRPVGPGGGVGLNPDFPTDLITPASPSPPRAPGNPNDFKNPDFPSNTLNPDFPGFPAPAPAPPLLPGHVAGFPSPGFAAPGIPAPGFFGPGFPGFPAQGPPGGRPGLGEAEGEGEEGNGEGVGEGDGLAAGGGVQPGALTCFSCKLDFRKAEYQWSHPCLGRHNGLNVSTDYLVLCGPKDNYCKAERTEVNGVLIYMARECTDICHFGCRPRGFGISYETCSKCCQTPACNHMYPPSYAPIPPTPPTFSLLLLLLMLLLMVA